MGDIVMIYIYIYMGYIGIIYGLYRDYIWVILELWVILGLYMGYIGIMYGIYNIL